MFLVDAHAHLDKYGDGELDRVIAAIERHRIVTLAVSLDPESYARTRAVAERSEFIIPSFGIHPWEAPRFADRLDEIDRLVAGSPLVGEIGLDRRWVEDEDSYGPQQAVLEHHLRLAAEQGKLVNLHTSGAEWQVAEALHRSGASPAIVHWYNGPTDAMEALCGLDCLFTVGVEVLVSETIREIAAAIPDDRLLIETDNPGGWRWLTGETAGPGVVHDVVAELARVRTTTADAVTALVAANLRRLVARNPHLAAWAPLLAAG